MAPVGAALWRTLRAHQVYGANTNVGKTIVSTILSNAVQRQRKKAAFLKPVSTGPLDEADDRHIQRFGSGTLTKCLYQFDEPVSPHLAAQQTTVRDDDLLKSVHVTLSDWASTGVNFALVETAGGVHSPGPNGNSQADLYRPLRLPIVLVADSRLGGISSSISAYESLLLRGYDVHSVLLFRDEYYRNHEYLHDYFGKKSIPLVALPPPPARPSQPDADSRVRDEEAMHAYYAEVARAADITGLLDELSVKNDARIDRLQSMADDAHKAIWYPFTQHQGMTAKDITVIDSAYDDYFQTLNLEPSNQNKDGLFRPTFDGSASWWTQGLGHGNPDLSLSAAYAAGRYGHVMFAGTIHEPALSLADILLKELGNPRFNKVFFTDNGSTGMEVAVKMGLRVACARYGWDASKEEIGIIGLKGSYHGDTIGVMDCSEPSTYNQKVEWYRGRGHWFDFPLVKMTQGVWKVEVPEHLRAELGADVEFSSLSAIFDLETRLASDTGKRYQDYIRNTIHDLVHRQGRKFGAVIMEPVILGAGGMLFSDPLFQRAMVEVVRSTPDLFSTSSTQSASRSNGPNSWSGLPIIFDEVFTGLYRLGRRTSASFLNTHPDIAVNAKLLTGGLIPLCTTVASQEIFDTFSSPEKSDALLHGHSYTAHAIGCQVAVDSMRTMMRMETSGAWDTYREDWKQHNSGLITGVKEDMSLSGVPDTNVWSAWSHDLVHALSCAESVESVFAIGTVLSISLKDAQGGGYTSTAAKGLQQKLTAGKSGLNGFNVHSRVLGNVLYLMASLTSKQESLREVESLLREGLL